MIILCDAKNCIYHVVKEGEGEAYQNQCGNDEVEIGESPDTNSKPLCYSFSIKD